MDRCKRLLRTPQLRPHEGFMGYALRITEANGYPTPAWILNGLCKNTLSHFYDDSADFPTLAALTGIPVAELKAMTYKPASGRSRIVHAFGMEVPRTMLRTSWPRICTACIRESGYIKGIWDLAPVTACPTHNLPLLDICPKCRKAISWHRSRLGVCRCGCDWLDLHQTMLEDGDVGLSHLILERCGVIKKNTPMDGANPLLSLGLADIIAAVRFIAFNLNDQFRRWGPSMANSEIHSLMTESYAVFANWPDGFHAFLEKLRKKDEDGSTLLGMFGATFLTMLKGRLSDSRFDFLRAAFETHMDQTLAGDTGGKYSIRSDNPAVKRRRIEEAEKKKMLKRHEARVTKLVDAGVSMAASNNEGGCVENESAGALSMRCLHATEDILTAIQKFAKPGSGDDSLFLSFQEAVRRCYRYRIDADELTKAVIDGRVKPRTLRRRKELVGPHFRKDEITEFLRHLLIHEKKGSFSIEDAAKILNIAAKALHHFVRSGHIDAVGGSRHNRDSVRIGPQSLDSFVKEYAMTPWLVKKSGTSARRTVELLAERGISPVDVPTADDGSQYLFQNKDIIHLNLKKIAVGGKTL